MIQAAFFKLFDFVDNNRWAQVVLGIGLFYVVMRWKEEVDEARGRRQTERKWEKRAAEQERRGREYVDQTREEAADVAEMALEARDRAGGGDSGPLDPDRMPGAQRDRIFGRHATAEGGG